MSLNKRTGLYQVPAHHLYGTQPAPRPSFNSMDFEAADSNDEQEVEKPRKKGRPKSVGTEVSRTPVVSAPPATSTPLVTVTPATGSSKVKSKVKSEIKSKESEKQEQRSTDPSSKKRKRQSEGAPAAPKASMPFSFVVGRDMLEGVKSSVKSATEVFSSSQLATAAHIPPAPASEPVKKKAKKEKASRKTLDVVDFERMAKETRKIDKKARKRERKDRRKSTAGPAQPPSKPAAASALVPGPAPGSSPPIFSSPPRKAPVPLPPNAFSHAANSGRIGRRDSRLLVLETPPQLQSQPGDLPDTPVPFKLAGGAKTEESHKPKSGVGVATSSSPSTSLSSLSPPPLPSLPLPLSAPASTAPASVAPPAPKTPHRLEVNHDGRVSLTASNLTKYTTSTQPLSHDPKLRPKPRATSVPASSAGSTTSVGTMPSIKEWFERVAKPYSRSGTGHDPFTAATIAAEKKKSVRTETHPEADIGAFVAAYTVSQYCVNFSDEQEYLMQHRSWRESKNSLGTLPCLGQKASGCNPKRETLLRLGREDAALDMDTGEVRVLVGSAAQQAILSDAATRGAAAEWFLARSIAARVPVPLGNLEGNWKLFCPAYAEAHVDKYGYGQRSLSLFSVAGSISAANSHAKYTARLSIPPRSMMYSLDDFPVPPHASFRSTTVQTTEEKYKMEIVFLGNGYLLLRVDLSLLLSGKEMRRKGRAVVMEFVGVYEKAVVWEVEEDEVEAEGRRLFAKYDGEV
ncbi:hypothetical protein G6514_001176 [Epicoccum nigrum]|nr:hypothetical protein G6514_001176 [Epicoccum nigrum]